MCSGVGEADFLDRRLHRAVVPSRQSLPRELYLALLFVLILTHMQLFILPRLPSRPNPSSPPTPTSSVLPPSSRTPSGSKYVRSGALESPCSSSICPSQRVG